MILKKGDPRYTDLTGQSVLLWGMWIANRSYSGFNQYIIQRALASTSLEERQDGALVPGIALILIALYTSWW